MKRDPLDEQALEAIGLYRSGAFPRAMEIACAVVAQQPGHVDGVFVLGNCLRRLTQHKQALELVDHALQLQPGKQKLILLRADLLRLLGLLDEAQGIYQSALQTQANQPDALHGFGCMFAGQRRYPEAITLFKRAVDAAPKRADLIQSLACALEESKQLPQADSILEHALTQFPRHTDLINCLAVVRGKRGRNVDAVQLLKQAIQLEPDHAPFWHNLSVAHAVRHDNESAISILEEALLRFPQNERLLYQLAVELRSIGEYSSSYEVLKRLFAISPNHRMGLATLSLTLLVMGDWINGWKYYELRWIDPKFTDIPIPQTIKRWNGEPLAGKQLLVWGEQGLGDHIQFIRFVRPLLDRGAQVTVRCVDTLCQLLRTFDDRVRIISREDPIPACDYCVAMMSLPLYLNITPELAGCDVPYVRASEEMRSKWSRELANDFGKLKIGLVWAGAPNNPRDFQRSVQLKQLKQLQDARPDAVFYSLQKEIAANQWMDVHKDWPLVDLGQRLHSWQDTAAVIEQLDLVICVDTAVAHLAGALGKPVWMMISKACDFRWLLESPTTTWYPTMRLYRQSRHRVWDDVIERIASDLQAYDAPRA